MSCCERMSRGATKSSRLLRQLDEQWEKLAQVALESQGRKLVMGGGSAIDDQVRHPSFRCPSGNRRGRLDRKG